MENKLLFVTAIIFILKTVAKTKNILWLLGQLYAWRLITALKYGLKSNVYVDITCERHFSCYENWYSRAKRKSNLNIDTFPTAANDFIEINDLDVLAFTMHQFPNIDSVFGMNMTSSALTFCELDSVTHNTKAWAVLYGHSYNQMSVVRETVSKPLALIHGCLHRQTFVFWAYIGLIYLADFRVWDWLICSLMKNSLCMTFSWVIPILWMIREIMGIAVSTF